MKKSLNIWQHPTNNQIRIYITGTYRDDSKLYIVAGENDNIIKHSINIDGTAKYIRGNIYDKRNKDQATITDVLIAFGYDSSTKFSVVFAAANGDTPLIEVISHE